jgi:hypothetical protein
MAGDEHGTALGGQPPEQSADPPDALRVLTKLDARDRVQLVIIAYDAGLVAPAR